MPLRLIGVAGIVVVVAWGVIATIPQSSTLSDIADADDTCIEHDGYAHSGKLTSHELFQIRALKAKQDAIMETVLGMKKDKAA